MLISPGFWGMVLFIASFSGCKPANSVSRPTASQNSPTYGEQQAERKRGEACYCTLGGNLAELQGCVVCYDTPVLGADHTVTCKMKVKVPMNAQKICDSNPPLTIFPETIYCVKRGWVFDVTEIKRDDLAQGSMGSSCGTSDTFYSSTTTY